jgi:hypothetical protein
MYSSLPQCCVPCQSYPPPSSGQKNPRARNQGEQVAADWRWRRYVPPKRRFTHDLHSATSQKTAFFIVTAVKTSNLIFTTFIMKHFSIWYMYIAKCCLKINDCVDCSTFRRDYRCYSNTLATYNGKGQHYVTAGFMFLLVIHIR